MRIYSTIAIFIIFLNVVAFIAFGIDKRNARNGKWRIPEAILLVLAGLGGAIGAHIGMQVFNHKAHKPKFFVSVPLFLILHLGFALCVIIGRAQ